jgi:chaperone required for assembly of F1-ATPase
MSEGSWSEAVRLTQRSLRSTPIKRIYAAVDIQEGEGGWSLLLDGRAARTPAKAKLILPSRPIAEAVAAEWAGQGETLDTVAMPMTRLANTAIDGVANTMAETRADIASYANSDLLCYRALEPEALAALQAAAFDPVLDWAHETLGARFILSCSLMHVAQPASALDAVRGAVEAFESPLAVAALHGMTSLTGSVLLALAVARGALSAEAAWRAAHVDEDFQISKWGEDDEAVARRAARWRDFSVAALAVAS